MRTRRNRALGTTGAFAVLVVVSACGGTRNSTVYFDPEHHPPEAQENFAVFARRCSKCHSLARPLIAGVTEVAHWDHYVARMVRQPGSGITPRDVRPILAFLYYYTIEVRGLAQPEDEETLAPPPEALPPEEGRDTGDDGNRAPAEVPAVAPTPPRAADAPVLNEEFTSTAPDENLTNADSETDPGSHLPVTDPAAVGGLPAEDRDSQNLGPGVGPE